MQSVNGAQFLNITFIFFSLFILGSGDAVFATDIVPVKSMYTSL